MFRVFMCVFNFLHMWNQQISKSKFKCFSTWKGTHKIQLACSTSNSNMQVIFVCETILIWDNPIKRQTRMCCVFLFFLHNWWKKLWKFKRWFLPANDVRSTRSLLEIHNRHVPSKFFLQGVCSTFMGLIQNRSRLVMWPTLCSIKQQHLELLKVIFQV